MKAESSRSVNTRINVNPEHKSPGTVWLLQFSTNVEVGTSSGYSAADDNFFPFYILLQGQLIQRMCVFNATLYCGELPVPNKHVGSVLIVCILDFKCLRTHHIEYFQIHSIFPMARKM
jgi:hypothetical protein